MSEEVEAEKVETDTAVTEDTESEATEEAQETEEDPAAGLKSALQKERAARKALEKQIREKDRELADRDKTPDEKALEAAKREAAAEATKEANRRVVQAEFRSLARERGIDPKAAVKLAELEDIEIGEDGDVDASSLADALDSLIEEYPSLAPSRFKGTADQGARGKKAEKTKVDPNELIRAAFQRS